MRRERTVERKDETAMADAIGDALAKARGVAELLEAAQAAAAQGVQLGEAAQAAAAQGVQLGEDAISVLLEAQEEAISGLAELENVIGGGA